MIIAVVGSGGKTTRIHKLRDQYRKQGKKVLITTTTHMYKEEGVICTNQAEEIQKTLSLYGYCMAGREDGDPHKIRGLSREVFKKAAAYADVVLVEADGSKGLPVKAPADHEPVIPEDCDEIHVVVGLSALGKPCAGNAHRLELVQECLGISKNTLFSPTHLQKLLRVKYIEPLKRKFPRTKIKICPAQEDTIYHRVIAQFLRENKDVDIIQKEWFGEQPELVIFGAGHVAVQLLKIAKFLGFYTMIVDDRPEFANPEILTEADEVYCHDFQKLEEILPKGNQHYYVIVTRGHQADQVCVETVLKRQYAYLGMIGSKKKVAAAFQKLKSQGYDETQIKTIHAPVGLPIFARTPEEIAISIAAEIIREKNQRTESTISKELFETKESGVLCIITKKSGSSPRGTGSMMLVTDQGMIGSIGGGILEKTVMDRAKTMKEITTDQFDLSNRDSAGLGMICGGKNEILYIPLQTDEISDVSF